MISNGVESIWNVFFCMGLILLSFSCLKLFVCCWMVFNLFFGFRYDIFIRVVFVILKEGGSLVMVKICKFCVGMYLC